MKKALKIFSVTVISLFVLSVFGWMVNHINKGDKNFGFLTGPVTYMSTFLDLLSQSMEEVHTLPKTFIPTPDDFESINRLDEDFLVLSTFSDTGKTRSIVLRNLLNDEILYKWTVDNPFREHIRVINPLLLEDMSIIHSFEGESGLRRIDSLGREIWRQDSVYAHHSLSMDSNGDLWICSFEPTYYATGHYSINRRGVFFKDNFITKINAETGKILYHKSVTSILVENGLEYYLLKSQVILDPLHINDVEPALKTTAYYREGDLFISARSSSIILQFRPATGEVIRVIEGPFASQHDVDFHGDKSLVIFNNNFYPVWSNASKPPPQDSSWIEWVGDFCSNIVRYDFEDGRISYIGDSIFRTNRIFTETEGLQEFVDSGTYYVEEQNSGILWIIRDDEVIYKNVFASWHEGHHHLPNWNRVIRQDPRLSR